MVIKAKIISYLVLLAILGSIGCDSITMVEVYRDDGSQYELDPETFEFKQSDTTYGFSFTARSSNVTEPQVKTQSDDEEEKHDAHWIYDFKLKKWVQMQ